MRGTLLGFGRDISGRRQLVLELADGGEEYLPVPKPLKKELKRSLDRGQALVAEVRRIRERRTGRVVESVSRVRVDPPRGRESACFTCPILVCAKKNCWRRGGRELFSAVATEIENRDLTEEIEVRAVGCLDRCKKAPNAESAAGKHRRLRPRDAGVLVAAHAEALGLSGATFGSPKGAAMVGSAR